MTDTPRSFTISEFLCWIAQQDPATQYNYTQSQDDVLYRFLEARGIPVKCNSYDTYYIAGNDTFPIFDQPEEHYSENAHYPHPSWGQAISSQMDYRSEIRTYEQALEVALQFMIFYEADDFYDLPYAKGEAYAPQVTMESTLARLQNLQEAIDIEQAHLHADKALCDFLTSLGYAQVVEAWSKVRKWYA